MYTWKRAKLLMWGLWDTGLALAGYPLILLRRKILRQKVLSSPDINPSEEMIQQIVRKPIKSPNKRYLFGICNICGCNTAFSYNDQDLYRESLLCMHCVSISRYRSIAKGILRAIRELVGIEASSISHLPQTYPRSLRILDTQKPFYEYRSTYAIPDFLRRCKWIHLQNSVYRPDKPLGAKLGANLTNQNVEALTFPDQSFDLVITSDVMEHVRLDDQAHSEIQRVLRPGGIYIFTVPSIRNGETMNRVLVKNPSDLSQDQFPLEKEFHDDPNKLEGKSLLYRIYGTDLDTKLVKLGFEVNYDWQNISELGILETELFFCRLAGRDARSPG